METQQQTNISAARRTRENARTGAGATRTIRIGYGDPDRPFAIRRMVLKKAPSQADTMDFVLVAEAVYVKALMPARPLPPSISDAPDAVLNVVAHETLEGVWVRLNSRIGEAQVEGFGRATGTLSSDPLTVSWGAHGDPVVVLEMAGSRLPVIVGPASEE